MKLSARKLPMLKVNTRTVWWYGQYGHCCYRHVPAGGRVQTRKGYEFINDIKGGVIPGEYIPAVDKGIQEQLKAGPLAGYPVVDMGIRLHFGSYHDVDSSELAFKLGCFYRL